MDNLCSEMKVCEHLFWGGGKGERGICVMCLCVCVYVCVGGGGKGGICGMCLCVRACVCWGVTDGVLVHCNSPIFSRQAPETAGRHRVTRHRQEARHAAAASHTASGIKWYALLGIAFGHKARQVVRPATPMASFAETRLRVLPRACGSWQQGTLPSPVRQLHGMRQRRSGESHPPSLMSAPERGTTRAWWWWWW